jgi:hypothetical protein
MRYLRTNVSREIRADTGAAIMFVGLLLGVPIGWAIVGFGAVLGMAAMAGLCLLAPLFHSPIRTGPPW